MADDPTFSQIWTTLRAVNCNDKTEKKGNLTYLSWAWAWGTLMDHFPYAQYTFEKDEVHLDGSVTVHCTIQVGACQRTMWLPVMDHRNRAVVNPDSRAISDSKMRCLTKGLAMFGLGHYIYAGEDIPGEPPLDNGAAPPEKAAPTVQPVEKSAPPVSAEATEQPFSFTTEDSMNHFVADVQIVFKESESVEELAGNYEGVKRQLTALKKKRLEDFKMLRDLYKDTKDNLEKN